MNNYEEKRKKLLERIDNLTKENIVLAFSGGVDSSLLLKICCDASKKSGKKVYAITVETELHPMKDVEIATMVAKEAGAKHLIIRIDELHEAGIQYNPVDRCYLCKKLLFSKLKEKAKELCIQTIVEGTNEDDLHVYRPGIRALKELEILSPLAECGFTKKEVRKLAEEYGISVANRPATPCMATRFPYGTELDYEKMRSVEEGEEWLRTFGFYNVRIRVHGDLARIEIDEKDMEILLRNRIKIIKKLKTLGYSYITIDLEGFRSGSMDINLK
ncbi:ATP-dependent sacrificial sulfur transferase LarE [Faecalimonas sp.]